MEFILVDDGSTDGTREMANRYAPQFEAKGIRYIYLYQENAGQAAAVNRGLQVFSGEYLTWPDADDWLTPDSVEKRVSFLRNEPQYSFVCAGTQLVYERDDTMIEGERDNRRIQSPHIFYDLLLERDVPFHDYMVETKAFLEALPERRIVESRIGQNWQMLLPIAYTRLCGYIDETLYYCLVREDSHCRAHISDTHEGLLQLWRQHEETLIRVIQQMRLEKREEEPILHLIHYKYLYNTAALGDEMLRGITGSRAWRLMEALRRIKRFLTRT